MKKIYILIVIFSLLGYAQPPVNYYNSATGTGSVLKTQLYNIIKGHNDRGYDGLYTTYQTSDRDYFYENDGSLLDMYSENPISIDPYNYSSGSAQQCGNYAEEGDCYNREHIIPQSVFNSSSPMKNDAHFVVPSDGKVNGLRNNYPFGKVNSASTTTLNGSKLGSALNSGYSAGYSGTVFEPIDEFKGDIARMYFYFATRYENLVSGYSYAMFNGTSSQVFSNTFKNILLQWNLDDPVSSREIARNNAVYARQNNRNPYIDNIAYVSSIWGLAPSQLSTDSFNNLSNVSVYPNPSNNNKINIYSEIDINNIQLININGQLILEIKNPIFENNNFQLQNLTTGFYLLKLNTLNQSTVKKVIIN